MPDLVPCYDCVRRPAERAPDLQPSRCKECQETQEVYRRNVELRPTSIPRDFYFR